jgi:hypothetical protein
MAYVVPQSELNEAYTLIDQIMRGVPGVTDERKQAWLDAVVRVDPRRILWHIRRLSGLGGSDIGTITQETQGIKGSIFTTSRKIIASKLMLRVPERSSVAMMVGTALEPQIREAFHQEMEKYDCHTDQKAYDALQELFRPENAAKRKHPWLIGNPDDIVLLKGRRYVVDYKVTMQQEHSPEAMAEAATLEVFSDYPYQLNHYTAAVRETGHAVDGMLLAKWVQDAEGYFALRIATVPFDMERDQSIRDAGDKAWAMRCAGQLPEYPEFKRVNYLAEHPEVADIGIVAEKFIAYKSLGDRFSGLAEEYKDMMRKTLNAFAPSEDKGVNIASLVTITTKPVLDIPAIKDSFGEDILEQAKGKGDFDVEKLTARVGELARELGKNPDQCLDECRGPGEINEQSLADLMAEQGAELTSFQKISPTIRATPSKDLSAVLSDQAKAIVETGFRDVYAVISGRDSIPVSTMELEAAEARRLEAERKVMEKAAKDAAKEAVKVAGRAAKAAEKVAAKQPKATAPSM